MIEKIRVAICQMKVVDDKNTNLKKAEEMIKESVQQGADIVVLPEVFNAPYQVSLFPVYAESYPGPTTDFLAKSAQANGICLVGGSILERDEEGKIYNSSFVFDDKGSLIGKHRKIHLFNIDIPGAISFKESSTLCEGNIITVIKYKSISFGLMICFDCRFPELARAAALEGAQMLIIPAAFNTTTGPAHWELLMRSRAVDNQLFVIAASPARNIEARYHAWGHSMVVDPWGRIIQEADETEQILYSELDLSIVDTTRKKLPLINGRRSDVYELLYNKNGNY